MRSIKQKVLTLAVVVVLILLIIWTSLAFSSRQTQKQYNVILERYLVLNEVNTASQQVITELNNFLTNTEDEQIPRLNQSLRTLTSLEDQILTLGHQENQYQLNNYLHLMDSLVESVERAISLQHQQDFDQARIEFTDATRIQNYISDTTLFLLDQELRTYDSFYRSIIEQSRELNQFGIWLLLLLIFTMIVVTYLFQRSITHPIHQLTEAANALSRGELDQEVKVDANDELAFLAKTFNRMRLNINQLITEIQQTAQLEKELQENKLLLQESQFRSLQSQINPHFLFNTLNTVSKKAYLEGAMETSDLLVNIADLLRYNLKKLDRSVTLRDELRLLRQYIDIQKARFTDRLIYEELVDETLLDTPIPALTLQPIIENAVIHAVEPYARGGTVALRIFQEGNNVRVEIKDDGPGMSDEKQTALLEGEIVPKEGHSTGIGFTNVIKRLRLFLKKENVVYIDSKEMVGTKISLLLPLNKGGDSDD
ncbi:sensor histidine kinase YesM [Natronobacillus azotifigens]|uniref:histidine kinase n=1 Tax=Natronobacillus azotifigens TaxID=472978 RepID=A0A9J6RD76_9BACI|nr:sensor histidine kinase [Natronobacillus azotifigens]MCZ0703161.1 sensor histidine kinase [Natronobacillus azotifigens]